MTTYHYLILDSRDRPVAHGISFDRPGSRQWDLEVDHGDLKSILSHEYLRLIGTSDQAAALEGRIVRCQDNVITVEAVRKLGEEVRRNLRMPARFRSFLYPISGSWKGRIPIFANDISCGGMSFYCGFPLEEGEIAQVVVPITSSPLLLELKVIRQRPSGEPIPLYAAAFHDLVYDQEKLLREAIFNLQFEEQDSAC